MLVVSLGTHPSAGTRFEIKIRGAGKFALARRFLVVSPKFLHCRFPVGYSSRVSEEVCELWLPNGSKAGRLKAGRSFP